MTLSEITKRHIEQKFGKPIRYPSDYDALAYDMERTTKQRISTNTLKRLWGAIESVKEPRLFTLDVLARYLGFETWEAYTHSISQEGDSRFEELPAAECHEIIPDRLPLHTHVEFRYGPDRRVVVEYLGNQRFRVSESINSKLQVGDMVDIGGFYLNNPLIISNVLRNAVGLGRFTAGKVGGLTALKIIK